MIKKTRRLSENDIKKVLKFKKPFFSHNWIANTSASRIGFNRYAVIFSGKHTKTSISRNFFRRTFYDLVAEAGISGSLDIVFVPKKGKTFDKTSKDDIVAFENDIRFLLRTIAKTIVPPKSIPKTTI